GPRCGKNHDDPSGCTISVHGGGRDIIEHFQPLDIVGVHKIENTLGTRVEPFVSTPGLIQLSDRKSIDDIEWLVACVDGTCSPHEYIKSTSRLGTVLPKSQPRYFAPEGVFDRRGSLETHV